MGRSIAIERPESANIVAGTSQDVFAHLQEKAKITFIYLPIRYPKSIQVSIALHGI
jgi:hypothetical protein